MIALSFNTGGIVNTNLRTAYMAYVAECARSKMDPLPYEEWLGLDDLVD